MYKCAALRFGLADYSVAGNQQEDPFFEIARDSCHSCVLQVQSLIFPATATPNWSYLTIFLSPVYAEDDHCAGGSDSECNDVISVYCDGSFNFSSIKQRHFPL